MGILLTGLDFGQIFSNYAFPAAMCLLMFWKMNEQDKDHKEESNKFAEAIENNTNAITTMTEVIRNLADK